MNKPQPILHRQWRPSGPIFTPTVKGPDDHIITSIGQRHDRFCRCVKCKPSLVRKYA